MSSPAALPALLGGLGRASLAALRQVAANVRAAAQRAEKNAAEAAACARHAAARAGRQTAETARRLAARAGVAGRGMPEATARQIFGPPAPGAAPGPALDARLDELLRATEPSPYLRCKVAQAYLLLRGAAGPP